jgi:tetratricopeptide (TPR) repeat protein
MLVALALLLGQTAFPAWSGPRPTECAPLAGAMASNVWERAKYPALRKYCDLLASGAAKLASGASADEAHEAIAKAEEAAQTLPGHAAPTVLRGRALAALGQWRDAAAAMDEASALDPHALDDPAALFAWGRALGRSGRAGDAETAFHALLPRASSLSPAERGKAEIEAAFLAEARGAPGLGDAIALFRQASHDAQDSLQALAVLALPLALDRGGEREEAHAILGDAKRDADLVLGDAQVQDALTDVGALGESDALAAFALEDRDAPHARALWAKYLAGAGGKGIWRDHARASAGGAPVKRQAGGKQP